SGGSATSSTSTLSARTHSITALYLGSDTRFAESTSPTLTQTVNIPSATTTTLASSANPSVFGQTVTLTAHVAPMSGSGTPTGTVTFLDADTSIASGTLSGGTATFSTSSLAVGMHTITASYDGDANFSASTSSAITQTVNSTSTNQPPVLWPIPDMGV